MKNKKSDENYNHKYLTKRFGKNFCASPWNSFHEGPNGLVNTCCKTRWPIGDSKKSSFEEMYNSDHAMSVRKEFLEGKKPQQCEMCWVQEESGNDSLNRISGNNMSDLSNIVRLVKNKTDKDTGYLHSHQPEWLDLLWSNKCNFACLGCVPDLSSTINKNFKEEFALLNGKDPSKYFADTKNWTNSNNNKIDYILKHKNTIKTIHLNGGEPFLNEDIYELLEALLKNNLHKSIKIWTHTNGSVTKSYKGVDIINDFLVHWGENASVTMSNDGHGKIGEYIRWGYNDKKWLSTFHKIRNANVKLKIQTCYNVFNACDIDSIGEWYLDNCTGVKNVYGSLTVWTNQTTNPSMLCYNDQVKNTALNAISKLIQTQKHPQGWSESLPKWKDWLLNDDKAKIHQKKYSSQNYFNLQSWYRGITALDKKRGTDLCNDIPKLKPLYDLAVSIN